MARKGIRDRGPGMRGRPRLHSSTSWFLIPPYDPVVVEIGWGGAVVVMGRLSGDWCLAVAPLACSSGRTREVTLIPKQPEISHTHTFTGQYH